MQIKNKNKLIRNNNIKGDILEKYNKQYSNLEIIINNNFHDRFIIIDKEILYHIGASLKDLGSKTFGINKIEDIETLKQIIKRIK